MLEAVGAKIVFPDEIRDTTKDVCFVDAQIIGANGYTPNIHAERYKAIPLAQGEVAAGPGMVPQDSVRGWVLALKDHASIKYRSNLVAVEIGKGQESMVPTLHPLDIVLIDKDDFRPEPDGSIFLVREPGPDAEVAVKRVYTQGRDGETTIQFLSDNPDKRSFPPRVHSLERDYDGDLRRAIVGRVVWSWSDMTKK
ncbi:MAG: helix-turn-helix transcriptional regulator [Acidobacteriota bacterium]